MFKEKTVSATEFKAKCLGILDNLDSDGILVTKHGRPIARILPVNSHNNEQLIGSMKGKIKIRGQLFSSGAAWDAESRHSHGRPLVKR